MEHVPIPDTIEAGEGAPERVILIHSSVAGARQWRALMQELAPRRHAIAVNLFGYGKTPGWPGDAPQTLADQARLVARALPDDGAPVALVGHSFGASVAMKLAAKLGDRVSRLVLIEPNPFYLLARHRRDAAFAEAQTLHQTVVSQTGPDGMLKAAACFADYWSGPGSWAAMPPERQQKFAAALAANVHEWAAVLDEPTSASEWASVLPTRTTVITARDTVRSIRELRDILEAHAPHWHYETLETGGHMAPLTAPEATNPVILRALG